MKRPLRPQEEDQVKKAFPLTEEEKRRVDQTPFEGGAEQWLRFGLVISVEALRAYKAGEMDFRQVMEAVHNGSIGCTPQQRMYLFGLTAGRALRIKPKELNRRKPDYPSWVKSAAVQITLLKEPDWRKQGLVLTVKGNGRNGAPRQPTILDMTIRWMVALGMTSEKDTSRLTEEALHKWYYKHKKAMGASRFPGRPRRK